MLRITRKLTPFLATTALAACGAMAAGPGSASASTPAASSAWASKVTVISSPTGKPVTIRSLADAQAFNRKTVKAPASLRRNFGWSVVLNFPYARVACSIGVVSGVVVAVYRYRAGTGTWPSAWMVYSWTAGACRPV